MRRRSASSEGVAARMMPGPAVSQAAAYRALKGVVAFARKASVAPAMELLFLGMWCAAVGSC
jgi:hypothetical protein